MMSQELSKENLFNTHVTEQPNWKMLTIMQKSSSNYACHLNSFGSRFVSKEVWKLDFQG